MAAKSGKILVEMSSPKPNRTPTESPGKKCKF